MAMVETSIEVSEEAGGRYLHFSSEWVQGAMRIARPWSLELEYTREMMAGLLFRPEPEWPRRALLIGLGAGSLAKFLYRHRPEAQLTVVEIDPQVVAAARQHFKLPEEGDRLRIDIADGAHYMRESSEAFDLILVDGFDAKGRSGALDSLPFYRDCRARLANEGLLVVNLLGRNRGFRQAVARIREAFDERIVVFPPGEAGNVIVFATPGEPLEHDLGDLKIGARLLQRATGLNLSPALARLEREGRCAGGFLRI
jgi:spermidine synthase